MSRRRTLAALPRFGLLGALYAVVATHSASARPSGPVLHEQIPPDPGEDLALHVLLDGELPAALSTPHGAVAAPDPRELPRASDTAYGPASRRDTFVPDRETRRPDVGAYDDPFTPSTAPFKRLEAFDAVRSDYRLYVRDEHLSPAPGNPSAGADDDAFFADLVVDLAPDRLVRIPSVGPGARMLRARLGVGATEIPIRVLRDGADNWFLQPYGVRAPTRARVVAQVAIARAALGGPLADVGWTELPFVAPLPENVARDAALVRSAIGVGRQLRPRDAIARLVAYFRGFVDSDDPPHGHRNVYLDLALSKKGVCRHRAFAFLVTAQSLGIPTRMVTNEAHAWVEVHDGALWRRIDLGGAGRLTDDGARDGERATYEPPADPFGWPRDAERGQDMIAESRRLRPSSGSTSAGTSASAPASRSASSSIDQPDDADASAPAWAAGTEADHLPGDDRPATVLRVDVDVADVHRGQSLRLHGEARAADEACVGLPVQVWVRAPVGDRALLVGTLATGEGGRFAGAVVVPLGVPIGDYDLVVRTAGDLRCGAGASED